MRLWISSLSLVGLIACSEKVEAPTIASNLPNVAAPLEPISAKPEVPVVSETKQLEAKINLNTASKEDFLRVPNVGDKMAHEFEEYRPYVSIEQFRREMAKYVSKEQIVEYEQHVYVPVDPEQSDVATLQQLPGIDEKEADILKAGRPYAIADVFMAKWKEMVTPEEFAAGQAYLKIQ